jgi:hypothetical protein
MPVQTPEYGAYALVVPFARTPSSGDVLADGEKQSEGEWI